MASTPLQFAGKIERLATAMPRAMTVGVETVAYEFKKTALAAAPRRLSNVGRKGAKLSVVYTVFGKNTPEVRAEIRAVPPGLWSMVESGTRPHKIPKRRNAKVLKFSDGGFAREVQHPGTRGKHPWAKAKSVVGPKAGQIFDKALKAELAAIFGA